MRRTISPREEGYVLAAVIIMLAVMMMLLAVAVPKVKEDIRRDQELEAMHRGKQYARAIQLYYRKFRHYPPNIEALEDTNMQRFLRKRYLDPLTGKDDWVPVIYGQNKAPLTMGYFGQPLNMGAAVLTGASASGLGGSNNIVGAAPLANGTGFTSAFGSSSGFTPSSGMPTIGGGAIIGVSPAPDKDSILIYKTKSHYTEWEFVYDPIGDRSVGYQLPIIPTGPPTNTGAPGMPIPTAPSPIAPR
ncbi:type II secretion system protein [Acidobacteria bacterium AB60]|nr:type II secretion system protein [Acidobacteria bacterium AB60]